MKNKYTKIILFLITILSVFFTTCHNSIMDICWDSTQSPDVFYEVDFQANYGQPVPGIQHIVHSGKIAKVLPITRGGYAFSGWFTGDDREWNFAEDRVTSNLVLYAKWELITPALQNIYTVTFQASGGNLGGRDYLLEPQIIVHGSRIIEPPALRKETVVTDIWYGFGGWYTSDGKEWNFAVDRVYSDITLIAKWEEPPHCLVTFIPNEGNPVPRIQDLFTGTRIVEPQAMNRTGYGFGGWYTDPNFASGSEWNFNTRVGSQDITLYAKWVTNNYTVTFNANGGSPAPPSQTAAHGTLLASPPIVRKSGESFLGWYTSDGKEWNFSVDTVNRDGIVLFARWGETHYVVRFDLKLPLGAASSPPPPDQELSLGRNISEPNPEDLTGYSFYGWFYTDNPSFDPGNPVHRNALKPWDFDRNIYLDGDDLAVYRDSVPEKLITRDEGENKIFTLYARWVPNVANMAWVRKGSFMMGAQGTGTSPVHNVKFTSGFYMAKYLVTQDEYSLTMTGLYSAGTGFGTISPSHFTALANRPVDSVSWYDAAAYCNRRSINEGLTPVYNLNGYTNPGSWGGRPAASPSDWDNIVMNINANGYRLPTEAEWEYAARGGNGSPGNYIYAGSNIAETVAWFNTTSDSRTHPVGDLAPNGLGIYDMSGNLMEWCWDWFDSGYYSAANNNIDPRGPLQSSVNPPQRVRRGGAWGNAVNNLRTVVRASFNPTGPASAYWVMGFRVVRGPTEIY